MQLESRSLGIAALLLLGCGAGGSRDGSTDLANPPQGAPERPMVDGAEPVPAEPSAAMTANFLGDSPAIPSPSLPSRAPVRRRGLLAKQVACGAGNTSVSGTVYIPSGQLPLYNAMVYVPDADLRPFTSGASCNCEITGEPIASALTDANGHFVMENVPVGDHIPLVIQVGDWRREFDIGTVAACQDNPVPDQTLRLPSRRSEGDLPRIAVATGSADALECLVRKLGVDESEFTDEQGGGSVNLFAGDGGTQRYASLNGGVPFPAAQRLWNDVESLARYDIVLLSCDGNPSYLGNKSAQALDAMAEFLNRGGRVFGSHFQSVWFERGPAPFPALADFANGDDLRTVTAEVVTSFPKGAALSDWLVSAGASPDPGLVSIRGAQHNIVRENPDYAQRWIATAAPDNALQYLSANTPLGAADAEQCGRVVLSDIHVSPGARDDDRSNTDPRYDFPNGCITSVITPQEAVLAFMLFDISACIVPDDVAPLAPTILR